MIAALGFGHLSGLARRVSSAPGPSPSRRPVLGAFFAVLSRLPGWWLAYLALLARPSAGRGRRAPPLDLVPGRPHRDLGRGAAAVPCSSLGAVALIRVRRLRAGSSSRLSRPARTRRSGLPGRRPRADGSDRRPASSASCRSRWRPRSFLMLSVNLWLGGRIATVSQRLAPTLAQRAGRSRPAPRRGGGLRRVARAGPPARSRSALVCGVDRRGARHRLRASGPCRGPRADARSRRPGVPSWRSSISCTFDRAAGARRPHPARRRRLPVLAARVAAAGRPTPSTQLEVEHGSHSARTRRQARPDGRQGPRQGRVRPQFPAAARQGPARDGCQCQALRDPARPARGSQPRAARPRPRRVAEKLDGQSFVIIRQAGETGQLYGSVSTRDVAEVITAGGFSAVSRPDRLDGPDQEHRPAQGARAAASRGRVPT